MKEAMLFRGDIRWLSLSPKQILLVAMRRHLTDDRALKAHFSALEEASDEPGLNQARGYACELVAWQFLTSLSERDAIEYLLVDLPPMPSSRSSDGESGTGDNSQLNNEGRHQANEHTALLSASQPDYFGTDTVQSSTTVTDHIDKFSSQFENLSALEIAAISGSKKFLSQKPVQKIINAIWKVPCVSSSTESMTKSTRVILYFGTA
jgi:hypothetical protein